jgi:hypothetical protein
MPHHSQRTASTRALSKVEAHHLHQAFSVSLFSFKTTLSRIFSVCSSLLTTQDQGAWNSYEQTVAGTSSASTSSSLRINGSSRSGVFRISASSFSISWKSFVVSKTRHFVALRLLKFSDFKKLSF